MKWRRLSLSGIVLTVLLGGVVVWRASVAGHFEALRNQPGLPQTDGLSQVVLEAAQARAGSLHAWEVAFTLREDNLRDGYSVVREYAWASDGHRWRVDLKSATIEGGGLQAEELPDLEARDTAFDGLDVYCRHAAFDAAHISHERQDCGAPFKAHDNYLLFSEPARLLSSVDALTAQGTEIIANEECLLVVGKQTSARGEFIVRYWGAVGKSYAPWKIELGMDFADGKYAYRRVIEVADYTQVAGVWVPTAVSNTRWERVNGEWTLHKVTTFTVNEVDLSPAFPSDFFSMAVLQTAASVTDAREELLIEP